MSDRSGLANFEDAFIYRLELAADDLQAQVALDNHLPEFVNRLL
jgi:hypothetical protein